MRGEERRRETRLDHSLVVFVEVSSEDPVAGTAAEILACKSVDVSAGGLQAVLDRALPIGAILRLGADPPGPATPIYVVGEVRWVREQADGWRVGFEFYDSDGTDIIAWKQYVADRLAVS